jgi:signal transduction histidine kinase
VRRQLILAFVTLVVAIVALYGVPRAFVLAHQVEEAEMDMLARGAEASAIAASTALDGGRPVTPELLEPLLREGERVEFRDADGGGFVLPAGSEVGEDDPVEERRLSAGATLRYSLSGSTLRDHVVNAVTPLALLGLGLIPLGVLGGALLARRLARPFSELADAARAMGTGDLQRDVPRYDVPEADEIATALRDSSRRLHEQLERERDVAVHASHELRTPITALRLALEDVAQWPDTTPEVSEELARLVAEVDRLADAVTTLLDARRRWSTPPGVPAPLSDNPTPLP